MLYVGDEIHLSYRAYFIGGILYMAEKKGEKMIGSYDIKVPEDTDVTLGYDMTANKVKNFKFSGIWTWIVSKLKGESISDLNTTNKTVVGAIKEVNTPTFTTATSRANINSGESQSIIMGKVKKWLADLGTAAFCSVVNNLTTTAEGSVLDARQGKNLSDALTNLKALMGNTDISAIGGGTLTGAINELNSKSNHNIPRLVPKDITSYYKDGSLWKRLGGTGGYSLYQDIYVGDYFQMSRVISAKNPDSTLQMNGTDWVTIASIGGLAHNGDNMDLTPNHLVMVPGKGFGGTQHFGRSRMNPTRTSDGGYKASEMNTKVLGAIATAGSTTADATINQQLYAEFGVHLKKTRELVTNRINATGINRYGSNNGCSNKWEWIDAQAILMSEVEVYGSMVWSSSGWDTGSANHQFELFANSKSAINNRSAWYWLKDVASASEFCNCSNYGYANCNDASNASGYVRPRFVIAA